MRKIKYTFLVFPLFCCFSCLEGEKKTIAEPDENASVADTTQQAVADTVSAQDITIRKDLLYDQYTLADSFIYVNSKKDTIERTFQWNKIKERLAYLENIRRDTCCWAVLQNYKNRNGESPPVRDFVRDEYTLLSDTFGVARYQSVALYTLADSVTPVRYGRDGTPVRLLSPEADSASSFYRIFPAGIGGEWLVKKKYVMPLGDTLRFDHVIIVDVSNQSIATLQNVEKEWLVRSMNPATTGVHRPPYARETPVGIFLLQEKKRKMVYLKDGSTETGGFAPYASRFTNGAHIHGIPSVYPNTREIEYSRSLGTTPRSHMCVRTATSHARFIYENFPLFQTVVFSIENKKEEE